MIVEHFPTMTFSEPARYVLAVYQIDTSVLTKLQLGHQPRISQHMLFFNITFLFLADFAQTLQRNLQLAFIFEYHL